MTDIQTDAVDANGLRFGLRRAGDGDRLALLLHGFPDDAGSMDPLIERFAAAGFTAVAPYMRGYGPTDRPPEDSYLVSDLAEDALSLVDALAAEPDPVQGTDPVIVGHDWGAEAAHEAARRSPDRVSAAVMLANPPAFTDRLQRHPRQYLRSWYMWFFLLPAVPERALRAGDYALVEFLWRQWSPSWDYPRERIESVKRTFDAPGTVEAALAYYRQYALPSEDSPLEVPLLVLGGREDGCIGPELFEESVCDPVRARCRCAIVEDAGHFLHQERPDVVFEEIAAFLDDVG